MKSKPESLIALVIMLFFGLPLSFFWCGYVTSVLWSWFVVQFGIAQISLFHAVGLTILVQSMAHGYARESKVPPKRTPEETLERAIHYVLSLILVPAFALMFGWLARLGM